VLDGAISFAREQGLWDILAPRITFAKGMLYHALDDHERALVCYQVVGKLSPKESDIALLAQISIVVLQFGKGELEAYEVEQLAREVVAASTYSVPSVKVAGLLVEALVGTELVKAK
jgi:hypothetical protein